MTDRQYALQWVNEIRAELGREPLEEFPTTSAESFGVPGWAEACPVARAIGNAEVYPSEAHVGSNVWELPPRVARFIRAIDNGKHPDLIEAG